MSFKMNVLFDSDLVLNRANLTWGKSSSCTVHTDDVSLQNVNECRFALLTPLLKTLFAGREQGNQWTGIWSADGKGAEFGLRDKRLPAFMPPVLYFLVEGRVGTVDHIVGMMPSTDFVY